MTPRSRAAAMVDLARNSFNFAIQGQAGFERLGAMVQACECRDFVYHDLPSAMAAFEALSQGQA